MSAKRYTLWGLAGLALLGAAICDAIWNGSQTRFFIAGWFDQWGATITTLSTALVAWFTFELRRSTNRLWDTSLQQMLSAHPPKIGVYQFQYRPQHQIKGALVVINEGGGDAQDVSGRIRALYTEKGLPQHFDAEPGDSLKSDAKAFRAGSAFWWSFEDPSTVLTDDQITKIQDGKAQLYLMGFIRFYDLRRVYHRTWFCRLYDHSTGRFVPTQDPDYEFQT